MRACVFGDSIAKGVVFDPVSGRYKIEKNSLVNLVRENSDIELENFSCFGCTVTKGLEIFDRVKDELKNYTHAFIEFGGNDCDYNWAAIAEEPERAHLSNTPPDEFYEKYSCLIQLVREKGCQPVLVTLPPIHSQRFFDWVTRGINSSKVLKFLGDVEHIGRWQSGYNAQVQRLAEEFSLPLVDIAADFRASDNIGDLLCIDGIHPNAEGHKLLYNTAAKTTGRFETIA